MAAIQTQRVTYFESLNTGSNPVLTTRLCGGRHTRPKTGFLAGSTPAMATKQNLRITFTKQNNYNEKKTHHHSGLP